MCASHISERLEVVHSQSISIGEGTTNEFGENIEGHFDTCHSLDDSDRDHEDNAQGNAIDDDSRRRMRVPTRNSRNTKTDSTNKASKVPPLGSVHVCLHQAVVHVERVLFLESCLLAEAAVQASETHDDLTAMIK